MVHFGDLLSNSVTRQVSFNRTKIYGKCQKFKCVILNNFQTLCMVSKHYIIFSINLRFIEIPSTRKVGCCGKMGISEKSGNRSQISLLMLMLIPFH